MCLAVPGKIVEIKPQSLEEGLQRIAKVDFGGNITREVNITLVDAKVGDYVVVHAGYAIQVLDETAAKETLNLFREILEASERKNNA